MGENKHLPFGGSTAKRTIKCPPWRAAAETLPKPPSSSYADEGNLLHDCMEDHYMEGKTFTQMLSEGRTYGQAKLTQDHEGLFEPARQATEEVLNQYRITEYACEAFVQYIPNEVGGSIDLLGKSADGLTGLILDYKFGHKGVPAKNNESLLFYAVATLHDPKYRDFLTAANKLVFVIVQPQVSSNADVWELTKLDVEYFKAQLNSALRKAKDPKTAKQAGEHCRYCPVAPYCEERKALAQSALMIDPKIAGTLSEALDLANQIDTWIKEVYEHAHNLMKSGARVPGYKLVQKRATSKWIDAEKAEAELSAKFSQKIYKKTLISPAQAAKLANSEGEDISHLIEKTSSGTTVAPESDKRKAVQVPAIAPALHSLVNSGNQEK